MVFLKQCMPGLALSQCTSVGRECWQGPAAGGPDHGELVAGVPGECKITERFFQALACLCCAALCMCVTGPPPRNYSQAMLHSLQSCHVV